MKHGWFQSHVLAMKIRIVFVKRLIHLTLETTAWAVPGFHRIGLPMATCFGIPFVYPSSTVGAFCSFLDVPGNGFGTIFGVPLVFAA